MKKQDGIESFIIPLLLLFSAGGTRKLSMAELEDSLAQIKEMLKERSNIIEHLTPPIATNY